MSTFVGSLDIGGTKIIGAIVEYPDTPDAPPKVSGRYALPTDPHRGGLAVLSDVVRIARHIADDAAEQGHPLVGIGIASAGCINPKDGSVLYATDIMPGWMGQPLAATVSTACSLPVAAFGDVHGHALGEARWGGARGHDNCLVVAVGTGLGGAVVLDGKVLVGAHGAGGHLGHTLHHKAKDWICSCGAESHVESVTSGQGIGALYQGVPSTSSEYEPEIDGAEVVRRASAGDEKAQVAVAAAGYALGQACGSWANIVDPEVIILSGSVCNAGDTWMDAVRSGYRSQALTPLKEVEFAQAVLGSDAPLIGAAEHLLDSLK